MLGSGRRMIENNIRSFWAVRIGLIITGGGLMAAGVICTSAPHWIAVPLEWIIGGAFFFAGMTGVFHLLAGLIYAFGIQQTRSEIQTDSGDHRSSQVLR